MGLRAWVVSLAVATGIAASGVVAAPAQAATQLCAPFDTAKLTSYIVMNNRWGSSAPQCIDVTANGFRISTQQGVSTGPAPLSYPAVYLGCHYTACSPGTTLPQAFSQISSVPTSISYTYAGGTFDASYDVWMDPTPRTDGVNQMEMMIWFNHTGGVQPVGSPVGTATIGGRSWQVWQGNNGGNDVVSYLAPSPIASWSFDVMDFVRNLQTRTRVTDAWYLTSVQAGFEPWSGGVGLSVDSFSAAVVTGGNPGGNPGGGTGGLAIVGQGSGRCVDLKDFGTADGTPAQLWDCSGNWNQRWSRTGTTLLNPQSGKCLDVAAGGTANGTAVRLWTCNGTGAQNWQLNANGTITNPQSGKCLDAAGQGVANGVLLQLWDCFGNGTQSNQVWTMK